MILTIGTCDIIEEADCISVAWPCAQSIVLGKGRMD